MDVLSTLHSISYYITGFPEVFPLFVALLLGTGFLVTYQLGFIQIRKLKHAFDVIRGKYDDPDDDGDVSHFQALTVALSATVGVGNIAGVALAIHWAGPGAVFWMWLTAIFGMALKYVECTLAMEYRDFDANGNAAGGPMYYIEKGLGWKWAGVAFAVCAVICSFATGNMNQSNTIASIFDTATVSSHIVGATLVLLVGAVIIGGVKRIASVTDKLLPSMALIYFACAALVLIANIENVPSAFLSIFTDAFNTESAFGGTATAGFSMVMLYGIKRGLFSNEAGQGSAPIAHACAKTKEPIREGVVAMAGPFIDTIIICSLTAITILVTDAHRTKFDQVLVPSEVQVCSQIQNGVCEEVSGSIHVTGGKLEDLSVEVNHADVEEASFLVDSKPFEGILQLKDGKIQSPPQALQIEGKALHNGAPLTSKAFEVGISKFFGSGNLIVDLSVLLFAFSTFVGWCYYGDRSFQYLFGVKYLMVYRLLYLGFVYLGAVTALDVVWTFGDIALALMAIPNLIAILFLHKKVVTQTKDYFERMEKL